MPRLVGRPTELLVVGLKEPTELPVVGTTVAYFSRLVGRHLVWHRMVAAWLAGRQPCMAPYGTGL